MKLILLALSPPIGLLMGGATLEWIWTNLKSLKSRWWLTLPENLRTGLLRVYLVVAVPWVAWYGYQIYEALQGRSSWHWRDISHSFWSLLIVPIGGPVSLFALFWVLAGFRKSLPDTNAAPVNEKHSGATDRSSLRSNPSPEVEVIYRKLDRLMTDEKVQCDILPEPFRSRVLGGDDCDEIMGATGAFGRDPQNPIPVNGPLGEVIYLSNLRTAQSQAIMFHRLGSIGDVDVYEIVSVDGAFWDILFLDLYHPRKSRRAPKGYRMAEGSQRETLLFGANEFVAQFPDQLQDAIANTYERLIGRRMRTRQVREAVERVSFKRPVDHQMILNSVMAALEAKASTTLAIS